MDTTQEIAETVREIMDREGVTMSSERIPARTDGIDDWHPDAGHFRVTFAHKDGRTLEIEYTMNIGHADADGDYPDPTPEGVLDCLASDAEACDITHDEWSANFGIGPDSIRGRDLYLKCVDTGHRIRRMFGDSWDDLAEVVHEY